MTYCDASLVAAIARVICLAPRLPSDLRPFTLPMLPSVPYSVLGVMDGAILPIQRLSSGIATGRLFHRILI
jgi:hypothetical protein